MAARLRSWFWLSALLPLLLLAGGGAQPAAAQTAGTTATLYTRGGTAVGTALVSATGAGITASVVVHNLTPNATYTLCVTDPLSAQIFGGCPPVAVGICPIGTLSPFCTAMQPIATTFTTDASGGGQSTVVVGVNLPTIVVVVTNVANPADSAQAVVSTGATISGTVCFPTLGAC